MWNLLSRYFVVRRPLPALQSGRRERGETIASRVYDELYAEYGREPTEEEVVSRLRLRVQEARTAIGAELYATNLARLGSIDKPQKEEQENDPFTYPDE